MDTTIGKHLTGAAIILEAIALAMLLTTPAHAQANTNYTAPNIQNQLPQNQNIPQNMGQNGQPNISMAPSTTQTNNTGASFDWRWLLPLVLLPLLYLAIRSRSEEQDIYEPQVAYHDIDRDTTYDEVYEDEEEETDNGRRRIRRRNVKKL